MRTRPHIIDTRTYCSCVDELFSFFFFHILFGCTPLLQKSVFVCAASIKLFNISHSRALLPWPHIERTSYICCHVPSNGCGIYDCDCGTRLCIAVDIYITETGTSAHPHTRTHSQSHSHRLFIWWTLTFWESTGGSFSYRLSYFNISVHAYDEWCTMSRMCSSLCVYRVSFWGRVWVMSLSAYVHVKVIVHNT